MYVLGFVFDNGLNAAESCTQIRRPNFESQTDVVFKFFFFSPLSGLKTIVMFHNASVTDNIAKK